MFEPTLPTGSPELMRASAFKRYLDDLVQQRGSGTANTRLSTLSPSLVQDLMRFEQGGSQSGVLDVVAAAVRHQRALLLHLQCADRVVPLTLFPQVRLAHCPMTMRQFLALDLAALQVLQVEPAVLRPPGHAERLRVADTAHYAPLSPVIWELALRSPRVHLLPEIAGQAAYRVSAGANTQDWRIGGPLAVGVQRLKQETSTLAGISAWPQFTPERAARMLNALYLHAALMVSRTHPVATNEALSLRQW